MSGREDLKKLIDELPEQELGELIDLAQVLRRRASQRAFEAAVALLRSAPPDDEPYTESEQAASAAGWNEYLREGGVPLSDLREAREG